MSLLFTVAGKYIFEQSHIVALQSNNCRILFSKTVGHNGIRTKLQGCTQYKILKTENFLDRYNQGWSEKNIHSSGTEAITRDYFSAKSRLHREHLKVNENICKLNCNTLTI